MKGMCLYPKLGIRAKFGHKVSSCLDFKKKKIVYLAFSYGAIVFGSDVRL